MEPVTVDRQSLCLQFILVILGIILGIVGWVRFAFA